MTTALNITEERHSLCFKRFQETFTLLFQKFLVDFMPAQASYTSCCVPRIEFPINSVCVKRYNFAAGQNQRIGKYGYLIKTAKNIRRERVCDKIKREEKKKIVILDCICIVLCKLCPPGDYETAALFIATNRIDHGLERWCK